MALTFERLQYLLEELNPYAYSGRNMYGKQCLAINTDRNVFATLANVIHDCDDVQEASALLAGVATDSMGRGTVVYWPNVKIPEGVTVGSEEDDE